MCETENLNMQTEEEDLVDTITLSFDSNIKILAGFPFGKSTFVNQAPENLNLSGDFYIKLPEHVACIASSFVNGFFDTIVSKIGLSETIDRVHIVGGLNAGKIQRELEEDLLRGFEDDDE